MRTKPKIQIDLTKVTELAKRGLTQEQIATALGISPTTLYARKKESKEFEEAIKRGQAQGIAVVTNKLMEQILDGNITAMIFYLKAKAGWKEVYKNEVTGADGKPIELTAVKPIRELSTEELLEIARMNEKQSLQIEGSSA